MAEELGLNIRLNKDFVLKDQINQTIYGVIEAWPNDGAFNSTKKLSSHIIFVLDSSGSMDSPFSGNLSKRQAVINVAIESLRGITSDDKISVITFNSNATILCRESKSKSEAEKAIKDISQYNGGTNFENAIKTVEKIVTSENNYVIFLTDGLSCEGDNNNAFKINNQLSTKNVIINTMGIGGDFDFNFMKQFSEPSNGITENITNTNEAINVFGNIISSAQKAYLTNVFLTIEFQNNLRDIEFYQQSPEKRFHSSKLKKRPNGTHIIELNIGNLVVGYSNNYVFKAELSTDKSNNILLADLLLSYSVPVKNLQNQREVRKISLNLSSNKKDFEPDKTVDALYADVELVKYYEEVLVLMHDNKHIEAAGKLDYMIKLASRIGDNEAEKTYKNLKDKIMKNGKLTQEDLNRLGKSSSRSKFSSKKTKTEDDEI